VRRVLDSAPLLDAVATQDTVTLVRSAIRGLLRACPSPLAARVRQGLQRADDYRAAGKPACDWDDPVARERLVDELTHDGYRALFALRGQPLDARVREAAGLLAVVVGQDIEETDDGRFRIAQGTAPDRVISTVDPEARHGHKTAAHGFDGYKAHIAIDPDSEIITAAEASTAMTSDTELTDRLLGDLVDGQHGQLPERPGQAAQAVAYGDTSYGSGANLTRLTTLGIQARVKSQRRPRPAGATARPRSGSTWPLARSPARPRSPHRSCPAATAAVASGSVAPAASARCGTPAPPARPAAR
jgi:hypothetical protein